MAAGVVGAITPWNFPFEVAIIKLAYALATGNTVVLKPAPDTPFNATLLGRLIAERTDIPAGVVNIVTGAHGDLAPVLAAHDDVDALWYFGSDDLSGAIERASASNLKRTLVNDGHAQPHAGPQPHPDAHANGHADLGPGAAAAQCCPG